MKLRFLNNGDLQAVHRQFSDMEMCRYFSDPPCTMEEAQAIIDHYQNSSGKGYLRYGMFHRETGDFIGTCGYHYWDKERSQVEIGYDVWKEYWKQGYASEALQELISICFKHLGVDCVYILTHPENEASMASVRKFGFEHSIPCRKTEEDQKCLKLMRHNFIPHD